MKKQVLTIVSVALASFLTGIMLSTIYLASGAKPPSVWDAINELRAEVSSLTNTVTTQQAQIDELQTQLDILNATKLGKPDYDSGWININQDQTMTITHNLGTTNVLVYAIGKGIYGSINQIYYGGDYTTMNGFCWHTIDNTTITIYRFPSDLNWAQVRLMLWKIPQP